MKFTLTTSAIGTLNPLGGVAVFNSVQDQVSGLQLPVSRNFHIQKGVQLTTDCSERKTVTASCEQFTGTGTGVATTAAGSFTICMPLVTSLDTSKIIPLALFNAGHQLFYTLNPAATVVSAGTYTVSNLEIVAALVTPNQQYLEEISRGLQSGGSLKIPLQLYKSVTSTLAASNSKNIQINTGYLGSMNTVTLVEKTAALGVMKNGADLQSFFINLDGQRYPMNKAVSTGVEAFYQTLAGYNTGISTLSVPDANQSFQHYSFKTNSEFSSGVPTANGVVELALDFTGSTPVAGSTIETIISYDALLVVSQNSCSLIVDV